MGRRQAREYSMHCLYQMDMQEQYDVEAVQNYLDENVPSEKDQAFTRKQIVAFIANKEQVDQHIEKYLKDWTLDRIARTDLAILRLAVTEMLFMSDIPDGVTANEAVELSKKFGDDHSGTFVNGVLGKMIRERKASE